MCGIAGIFQFDREAPVHAPALAAMTGRLAHRGPDDSGAFTTAGAALGFTRLSIIDLGGGNQPHFSEDGSIVSVCNGEIYNFRELRASLEQRGHRFRSRCDVEVLVHLYEEYGAALVDRLNGQFAFAILDRRKRELLLARDHAGIAPLFYTRTRDALLFASEIKALLVHPDVHPEVHLEGLDQVLTFPGLVAPATMFRGIHALPAGHLLRVREDEVALQEYWDLDYPVEPVPSPASIDALDDALRNAVSRRLVADVPVGFYLSGGLDSSLIGSMVHALRPDQRFHSFSIAFADAAIDERRHQRTMARRLETIHHETEFAQADIIERLRDAVWFAEAPLKESYDTCSLALSRLVRDSGLKVVLTGEGADELFAGYVGYRMDETRMRGGEDELDELLEDELREELWGDPRFFYERDYYRFREVKRELYAPDVAAQLPSFDATRRAPVQLEKLRGRHPMHRRSYIDFKLRLSDHLLADHGDRVAYASSVEARYPFLDRDVIEIARTLPPSLLVRDSVEKFAVREVARRYLPREIAAREKFGFVAPGSPYLLRRRIDWIEDLLAPATIKRQGLFDVAAVERLKAQARRDGAAINTTFETDLLMIVLTMGIFLERFVESRATARCAD
ncbi:MAG TPA: asparagine synthase (glutamine-hydrolyzing) [Thermoanaerobaculia bacterium]|jgi:asparagine synthase (glutamine-hydrolysing)